MSAAAFDPAALFDLGERSALVTGATGALGTAAARGLAAAGAKLTLAGGNAERLEELGEELRAAGASVEHAKLAVASDKGGTFGFTLDGADGRCHDHTDRDGLQGLP